MGLHTASFWSFHNDLQHTTSGCSSKNPSLRVSSAPNRQAWEPTCANTLNFMSSILCNLPGPQFPCLQNGDNAEAGRVSPEQSHHHSQPQRVFTETRYSLDDETVRGLPSPTVSNSAFTPRAAYSPAAGKLGNPCFEKQCKDQGQNQAFKGRERCNPGDPRREVVFNLGEK